MRGTVMSSSSFRFGDGHGDVHREEGFRGTRVGTPQGQHLIGSPRYGYANEITVADDAVAGGEVDPASAGQIGLHPGMRVTATCEAGTVGHENITADKPRRNAQRPGGFHHQDGEIPATSAPIPQRLLRSLHAFLSTSGIDELFANAAGHGAKYFHGAGSIRWIQKLQCPSGHALARVVPSQSAREIRSE